MTDLSKGGQSSDDARRANADEGARLVELEREIAMLRERNAALESKLAEFERSANQSGSGMFDASTTTSRSSSVLVTNSSPNVPAAPPLAPPLVLPQVPPLAPALAHAEQPQPQHGATAHLRVGSVRAADDPFDTERFIGRRVLPMVGAIAVIGAVGFLVHYAIDTGLWGRLPAEVRFLSGILTGAALLVGGEVVRRRAPGAAVGLDAAGVGAFLVTIALGVYGLELFDPRMGAILSGAAGVFGAAWSVRTRSAAVGTCALIGLIGAPVLFGLLRESVMLAGSLLTVGILSGVGMQLLAEEKARLRFEVPRFVALAAALLGGLYLLDMFGRMPSVLAIGFLLLWFGAFVASSALLALRGFGGTSGSVVLAIVSVGAFVVQLHVWGMTTTSDLRAWFPALAGGALVSAGLLLRSFVEPAADPEEVHDPREEMERTGLEGTNLEGTSLACSRLSSVALALGVTLFVGGFVHFAPRGGQSFAAALMALGLTFTALRCRMLAFDILGALLAVCAGVAIWWNAFEAMSVTSVPITLPLGAVIGLRISWEMVGVVAGACALFAAASWRVRIWTDSMRAAFAAFAWCAPAALFSPDIVLAGLFALPAAIMAFVPRVRRSMMAVTLALLPLGYLVWGIMLLDVGALGGSGWQRLEIGAWSLAVLAVASVTAVQHASLGAARTALAPLGFAVTSLAVSIFAVSCGDQYGLETIDLTLVFVAVAGMLGAALSLLLPRWVRFASGDAAVAGLALVMISTCIASISGLAELFNANETVAPNAWLTLLAIAAVAVAAWGGRRALDGNPRLLRLAMGTTVMFAVAVIPLGALLFAAILPVGMHSGLGALAVAGWILVVGVGEIALGFLRRVPALRWGGLIAFVLLVLRLFFVDLAGAPTLIRVALLFATGLVLVGVGIFYARNGRSPAHESTRSASGTIAP